LCALFELKCAGSSFDGDGKVELAGFTDKDLGSSAKGTLHFEWKKGTIAARESKSTGSVPSLLTRFDHWTADAVIADGDVKLDGNRVQQGPRNGSVSASIKFGDPPTVSFAPAKGAAGIKK
jgi:hypothetical protein